ncbi:hypothetical protein ACFVMC_25125 [Nocardia sp. NPDC127579]|uniref:hypothetical protein n=1 Tax=Nocardia sp. NPDC127579 TaxID=3345402 RepID=UPI0036397A60
MATGVGLRIAEDESTAAILTDDGELQYVVRESVLHMADDGDTVLGGPAPAANAHSIGGFLAAVGNPAGISIDDGEAYRAEDLVATALFCLINLTAEHLSGPAEFYATHPAHWLAQDVQALREALDYLGLRSVVLVSEADIPAVDTAEPNKSFAYDAARAALAAVLATPAGATPPDPGSAENSTVVTDIIPQVPASAASAQAYSAALPAASSLALPPPVPAAAPTPTQALAAPAAEAAPAPAESRDRRIPLLIAGAALIGLLLGGIGMAVLFRGEETPAVPGVRDAKSEQSTVATTPPPIAPVVPTTTEPPVTITTTEEPEPTTAAPPPPTTTVEPTTEAPSVTTAPPTSTTTTTTRRPRITVPTWRPPDLDWTRPSNGYSRPN